MDVTCDVVWFVVWFEGSVRQVERYVQIVDYFDVAFDDFFQPMVLDFFLKVFLYSLTLWSTDVFEHCKSVVPV